MTNSNHIPHPHLWMTMSLRYLETQIDQLDDFGFDRKECLSVLGLKANDFQDLNARVDVRRVEAMFVAASQALNDNHIGLRVGHNFRVPTFAQTGSIYSYCNNLVQVFEMNTRYQPLAIDAGRIKHTVEKGRHFFVYEPYPEAADCRHVLSMVFAAYATAFRWMAWKTGKGLKAIELIRSKPEDTSLYEEVVRCPIRFGAKRNRAEFYAESVYATLLTADPEKLARSVSILEAMLKNGQARTSFTSAVKASIRSAIQRNAVNLAIVAARMDMSERSLREALRKHGMTYRSLLDEERQALFEELQMKGNKFAAISQELGYSDQAAFNRAFKRWYGMTPGEYKKRNSSNL